MNGFFAWVRYASRGNASISFGLDELVWNGVPALPSTKSCQIRSIWDAGAELEAVDGRFLTAVPAGDVVFIVIHNCTRRQNATRRTVGEIIDKAMQPMLSA